MKLTSRLDRIWASLTKITEDLKEILEEIELNSIDVNLTANGEKLIKK